VHMRCNKSAFLHFYVVRKDRIIHTYSTPSDIGVVFEILGNLTTNATLFLLPLGGAANVFDGVTT